jgi:hypothetical protein
MVKNRREVTPTFLQKGFMLIVGVIVLGSFVMIVLQTAQVIPDDNPYFSHILFSSLSAIFGFLLGNNVRTIM